MLVGALLLIWYVERDRLFAALSKTPAQADASTKALVPIWWLSLALMLNATAGLPGVLGLVITSLIAAIVLLACARCLARANAGAEMLARPQPERRLLLVALVMLSFGSVIALFNTANSYSADRQGVPAHGVARLPVE